MVIMVCLSDGQNKDLGQKEILNPEVSEISSTKREISSKSFVYWSMIKNEPTVKT